MHLLIKKSSTGCSEEFANKMGISKRQLLEDLSELKSIGAPIKFSSIRNTYHYEFEWMPFDGKLSNTHLYNVKGGLNFTRCSITALEVYNIPLPNVYL